MITRDAARSPAARVTAQRWSMLCTAVASVLLLLALLAGLVNRNILDGPRFARHVDAVRRDPAVTRQVGAEITDRALGVEPDLVALRPLIETAATALVGSPAFGPLVRVSVRQLHAAFTGGSSGQVVLRLADVGAVLAAVLPTIAPQAAGRIPAGLDVTLAQLGQGSLAARTIHFARIVGVLAWLLPVLALLVGAAGPWLAPDRARATVRTGWAVMAAGVGVGAVALTGAIIASLADEGTLRGALVAAGWRELGGVVWRTAALTVAAGAVLVAAATARIPELDLAAGLRHLWSWITSRPSGRWAGIGRGATLAVVGAGAVLRPGLVFGVLGSLAGLLLLIAGVGEVAAAVGARRQAHAADADLYAGPPGAGSGGRPRPRPRAPRWITVVALMTAAALVIGLLAVDATPANRQVSTVVANSSACNGHVELCARRYNDVAFPATHNAMSAADEPGWFIPEQPTGLIGQLDAGVRVLLIDSWYGRSTQRPGLVATAPGSYAGALAEAEQLYGRDVVASALRVREAVTPTPTGPIRPYLCHGLCEFGSTDWASVMVQVRSWLAAHPREVVTFFIEDEVSPADTAALFEQAGLMPYVHTQQPGQPWPTLGEMIDSGRRLVVLMENHGGGSAYPWLLQGFNWVQDTPFTNSTVADLTCRRNRGTASGQLFLVNYWLNDYRALVTDSRKVNAYDVLAPYLARCRQERGRLPNFVAVNFYNEGDLFRAVDALNGLR